MADFSLTVGDLFKAKAITDDQVNAAVEAYLADPGVAERWLAGRYLVDVTGAIVAHPFARAALSGAKPSPYRIRSAVRSAILLAWVTKA